MGLYADAKSIAERDPAAKGFGRSFCFTRDFVLISHQFVLWFYRRRLFLLLV